MTDIPDEKSNTPRPAASVLERSPLLAFALLFLSASVLAPRLSLGTAYAAGDPANGQRAFLKCVACHSVEPNLHKTGPSLANIWGREAATVEGFIRYSAALKNADVVWNEATLDAWLKNPREFLPGNSMTFRGIPDGGEREDIIAYLKRVGSQDPATKQGDEQAQGMDGMMGATQMADLKTVEPARQVAAIEHCGDTYTVTTASGEARQFWEFNLRFKTDSSELGPPKGRPALLPASMMGDRAFVIFSSPEEISAFIDEEC